MNRINLIAWPHRQRQEQRRRLRMGVGLSLLSAVALALLASLTLNHGHRLQAQRHADLHQAREALQDETSQAAKLEADIAQLQLRCDMAQGLRDQQLGALALFDELPQIVPPGLALTAIRQEDRALRLSGEALSHEPVAVLMDRLERMSRVMHRPQWTELRSVALSLDRPALPTGLDWLPTDSGSGSGSGSGSALPSRQDRVAFSVAAQLRHAEVQPVGAGPDRQGRLP